MKYILPILFLLKPLVGFAQPTSKLPDSIPIRGKKAPGLTLVDNTPLLKICKVTCGDREAIPKLANKLIAFNRNAGKAYNSPLDSIDQPHSSTMKQIMFSELHADTVKTILIVELWKQAKDKTTVEILAIAPAYMADGKYYPLFWNRYSDVIATIKEAEHYFDKKENKNMYEIFQERLFTSIFIKNLP